MNISKIGIPSILPDNDIQYLNLLFSTISSVDEGADIVVVKTGTGYNVIVRLLKTQYRKECKKKLILAHKLLGLETNIQESSKNNSLMFSIEDLVN